MHNCESAVSRKKIILKNEDFYFIGHTMLGTFTFVPKFMESFSFQISKIYSSIELLKNNSHGLSPPGGLVSSSGGFVSLLCDQPGPSNGILH